MFFSQKGWDKGTIVHGEEFHDGQRKHRKVSMRESGKVQEGGVTSWKSILF